MVSVPQTWDYYLWPSLLVSDKVNGEAGRSQMAITWLQDSLNWNCQNCCLKSTRSHISHFMTASLSDRDAGNTIINQGLPVLARLNGYFMKPFFRFWGTSRIFFTSPLSPIYTFMDTKSLAGSCHNCTAWLHSYNSVPRMLALKKCSTRQNSSSVLIILSDLKRSLQVRLGSEIIYCTILTQHISIEFTHEEFGGITFCFSIVCHFDIKSNIHIPITFHSFFLPDGILAAILYTFIETRIYTVYRTAQKDHKVQTHLTKMI